MSMTEAEALKKWCPFSRVRGTPEDGSAGASLNRNRDATGELAPLSGTRCIASGCMAWGDAGSRYQKRNEERLGLRVNENAPRPDGDGWEEVYSYVADGRPGQNYIGHWRRPLKLGFCGLAGNSVKPS